MGEKGGINQKIEKETFETIKIIKQLKTFELEELCDYEPLQNNKLYKQLYF